MTLVTICAGVVAGGSVALLIELFAEPPVLPVRGRMAGIPTASFPRGYSRSCGATGTHRRAKPASSSHWRPDADPHPPDPWQAVVGG